MGLANMRRVLRAIVRCTQSFNETVSFGPQLAWLKLIFGQIDAPLDLSAASIRRLPLYLGKIELGISCIIDLQNEKEELNYEK